MIFAQMPFGRLFMYIDPGTGSMLFTVLISVIGAAVYFIRTFSMKLFTRISGGKVKIDAKRAPFVIFSDNKRYWNVFEPVVREMGKRGKEIVYLTASEDDPVFQSELDNIKPSFIGEGNRGWARLNAVNAVIVLSTTPGLDVYQWKRSPRAKWYVHIPHAPSELVLYRMFGLDYYDAVLLSGAYQGEDIRELEKIRNLPEKEFYTIGIPYMDEMANRLAAAGEVPAHETTVLLAPTWGKNGLLTVYGGKIIDELLKTGYHIIVRPHPQSFTSEKALMDDLKKRYPPSEQLEWNDDRDNFEVLRRSDILLSDYSGVVFDFSLIYNKPVLYSNPEFNLAPYDAWWLNRPLWTQSALKWIGNCLTPDHLDHLKELIDECLHDPRFAEGRQRAKKETWEYPGEGAVRTADYLIRKYDQIVAEEAKLASEAQEKKPRSRRKTKTSADGTAEQKEHR